MVCDDNVVRICDVKVKNMCEKNRSERGVVSERHGSKY